MRIWSFPTGWCLLQYRITYHRRCLPWRKPSRFRFRSLRLRTSATYSSCGRCRLYVAIVSSNTSRCFKIPDLILKSLLRFYSRSRLRPWRPTSRLLPKLRRKLLFTTTRPHTRSRRAAVRFIGSSLATAIFTAVAILRIGSHRYKTRVRKSLEEACHAARFRRCLGLLCRASGRCFIVAIRLRLFLRS